MKIKYSLLTLALLIVAILTISLAGCAGTTTPTPTTVATTPAQSSTPPPAAATPTASATPTVQSSSPAASVTLNIQVAASLTAAIKDVDTQYNQVKPNITLTPNFASSGTLQKQIEQGGPADIFISAAAAQMDALQKENLIVIDTRKDLLNNKVVLVVPNDSTLGITSFQDLAKDTVKQIAIGDPKSVPAGTYAQQAFDELGITAQVQPKYVMGADVKAVLSYVESGNVDAGIVYSTDALTSTKIKVVASAPDDINAKVVYPIAVVATSKYQAEAKAYEDHLFGTEAKAIFEKYGFTLVSK